jgi:hypothetical protein
MLGLNSSSNKIKRRKEKKKVMVYTTLFSHFLDFFLIKTDEIFDWDYHISIIKYL